jgi:3-isopropylmalate/(R)-2-methylmalate dehydratase small subunit
MPPFTTLTAIAAPLLRANIDTDVVIRVERLVAADWANIGKHCFESWRYRPDGSENPDFLLNQPPYREAAILLAGPNFGCGSSREAAVWALMGMGYRAVIAPSFGDIFHNNCFQNGLVPVVLPLQEIEAIAEEVRADPTTRRVTVDLAAQSVVAPGGRRFAFPFDPMRKAALLEGLTDIEFSLRREADIAAYQRADRARRPWVYEI